MGNSKFTGTLFWNRILIVLVLGLAGIVIWMGLTRPQTSMEEPTLPALVQATADVPEDQDMLIILNAGQVSGQGTELIPVTGFIPGDVSVLIPAGSIRTGGTMSIIKREPDMFSNAGEPGWTRPVIVNVEYQGVEEQSTEGISLTKPLEVCFSLTADEWQNYSSNPANYQVQAYDESIDPPTWTALSFSEKPGSNQLCGQADTLALYALAIKIEIPPTPSEIPTGIYVP